MNGDEEVAMLRQSAKLDARGWVIGFGSLWLLVAVAKRDYFAAVAAVGVIIAGFATTSITMPPAPVGACGGGTRRRRGGHLPQARVSMNVRVGNIPSQI
jgi:hypothetical protein